MLGSTPYIEYLTYSYRVGNLLSPFYRYSPVPILLRPKEGKQCVQVLTCYLGGGLGFEPRQLDLVLLASDLEQGVWDSSQLPLHQHAEFPPHVSMFLLASPLNSP